MALRQHAQALGRMCMRGWGIGELRERISPQAVCAALKDDELGGEFFQMRFHARPRLHERRVARTGGHLDIEFGAHGGAATRFRFTTAAGI